MDPGWSKGRGRPWSSEGNPSQEHGHSTSKIPPYWDPSLERRGYPFRVWVQDLEIWAAGTELGEELRAPAVAQRLGGAARAIVREVPADELRDGRYDPVDGAQVPGLVLLIRGLRRRYGQLPIEASTQTIIEMLSFKRRPHESVDDALCRFETVRRLVAAQAAWG